MTKKKRGGKSRQVRKLECLEGEPSVVGGLRHGLRPIEAIKENSELGINRSRNGECGLRPIGAYAYAPAGMRKIKAKSIEQSGIKGERQRWEPGATRIEARGLRQRS